MKLQIGYTEAVYTITLYNVVQGWELADARRVETDYGDDGTVWFNIVGKNKPVYKLGYEELETASATSNFKKIQEMSIPDYLLPVWVKLENANTTNQYTVQTEYEGLAYIQLIQKNVSQVPTLRDFEIAIYTQ